MSKLHKWTKFLAMPVLALSVTACTYVPGSFDAAQNQNTPPAKNATPWPAMPAPANYGGGFSDRNSYGASAWDNVPQGASNFTPPYTTPNYAGAQFTMTPPTPGVMTGTEVGQKVEVMRTELQNLQSNIQSNSDLFRALRQETEMQSQAYHGVVAAISARLQVGTTPGNPILVQQWNEAQAQLDRVNENIGKLNNVATMTAANSTVANYMLEAVKSAYSISGAIDEDHRQLRILEDDINRTVVMVERLLKELSEDVSRQTSYISGERSNLTALSLAIKNGELYGMSLANRSFMSAPPAAASFPGGSLRPFDSAARNVVSATLPDISSTPLIVIRFDKPNVSYERELYSALSKALERKPDAQFNLVSVSPGRGNPASQALSSSNARKSAEMVLRSLMDMGLPSNRVALSSQTSISVEVNEVHLYIR